MRKPNILKKSFIQLQAFSPELLSDIFSNYLKKENFEANKVEF